MTTKTRKYYPPPHIREELRRWPVGEVRGWRDIGPDIQARTYWLINNGYLEVVRVNGYHTHRYRRLNLQPPIYKPRMKARKKPSPPFPHSVAEHWRQILKSPARLPSQVAYQLTQKHDSLADVRAPYYVATKSELRTVRNALKQLYLPSDKQYLWLPQTLRSLFSSGVTMRLLFLDLLIEPSYKDGVFVEFIPIDPELAKQELDRLVSNPGDIVERYRRYMQ